MEILIDSFWIVVGLVLLYFGAEWLVGNAIKLAHAWRISTLITGVIIVAFGTSYPELSVALEANKNANYGISFGNVIGSNICNLCLILGLAAVCSRQFILPRCILVRDLPVTVGSYLIFLLLLYWNTGLQIVDGAILFGCIISYTIYCIVQDKKQQVPLEKISPEAEQVATAKSQTKWHIVMYIAWIIVGFFCLKYGAVWLVQHGTSLAAKMHIPNIIIGLFAIAIGTSLPEIAATIAALRKREYAMIYGNVLGSCIFNIFVVFGVSSMIYPLQFSLSRGKVDLLFLAVIMGVLSGILWWQKKLSKKVGWWLLLAYLVYVVWRIVSSHNVS